MRYHAFISYSHGADARLAPALQRALHRFAKPWWQARAVNVFRDETSLALAHSLPDTLTRALEASEHFILMASPLAAQSKWVASECEWWAKHKDPQRLLVVLSEGEIAWDEAAGDFDWTKTNSVPPALKGVFKHEPLYLDLRWARAVGASAIEEFSDRDPRFLGAVAKISAALRGMSLDAIAGEEVRQHRKTRRIAYVAVSAIALLAAGATAGAWIATERSREAERQRAGAERNLVSAMEAADTLVIQIADGMKDFERVPLARRLAVLSAAESLFTRLREAGDDARLRHRQAMTLLAFAEAYMSLGNSGTARARAETARDLLAGLARDARGSARYERDVGTAYDVLANVLFRQGDIAGALEAARRALAGAERLAAAESGNPERQRDLAVGHVKLATLLVRQGDGDAALAHLRAAIAILERLAAAQPNEPRHQRDLGVVWERLGVILAERNELSAAVAAHRRSLAASKLMREREPANTQWARDVAVSHNAIGKLLQRQGQTVDALRSFEEARGIAEKLVESDERNAVWLRLLAASFENIGDAHRAMQPPNLSEADFAYLVAFRHYDHLVRRDPNTPALQHDLALINMRLGLVSRLSNNKEGAGVQFEAAREILRRLAKSDPANSLYLRQLAALEQELERLK